MFKSITINMTSPICQCLDLRYEWSIIKNTDDTNTKYGLKISCITCKTIFIVPPGSFRAGFNIEGVPKVTAKADEVTKEKPKSKPERIRAKVKVETEGNLIILPDLRKKDESTIKD